MPRPLLLLFALTALALFIACGGDNPESRPQFATATPVPAPPTVTPTPTAPPANTPVPADPTPVTTSAGLPETEAWFEPDVCRIREPQGVIVQCGNLVVPENRSDPDSRMIELHVMVFGTASRNPAPDPLLYLAGGPGSSIVEDVPVPTPPLPALPRRARCDRVRSARRRGLPTRPRLPRGYEGPFRQPQPTPHHGGGKGPPRRGHADMS